MKNNQFITVLSICLGVFYLAAFFYLAGGVLPGMEDDGGRKLSYVLLAQCLLMVCISGIIYEYLRKGQKVSGGGDTVSKLIFVSDAGEIKKEIDLSTKQSVLIGSREDAEIDLSGILREDSSPEHAVLNAAEGYWYVEAVTEEEKVGLKHESSPMVYRLKVFMPYKLAANDVIYVAGNKILVK